MGQATKEHRKLMKENELAEFTALRDTVEVGRLGLALTAIRQRIEQELMISIAAYEIDVSLDNKDFRINRDTSDAIPEILTIKARLDATDALIEKYQEEMQEMMAAQEIEVAGWEDQVPEEAILEMSDVPDPGVLIDDSTDEATTEADPADSDA